MTHLIKLATGKLNDPILMDWALDRYRQASEGHSQRQEAMEQAWFDELTLRRWLNSDDHETLKRLFVHLPEERFSNLGQAIADRKNSGLDDLMVLLDRLLDEKDHNIVQLISETRQSKRLAEHSERLEAFLVGMVASACEHKVLDATQMSIQETVTLLAVDLAEARHFEALLAGLRMFDQGKVMPALVESLERERTAYGSLGMARAMGVSGWEGFTTPLTASLQNTDPDYRK